MECAICLEMFVKGDRVRVLPCYHLFHIDEIDEWLIHKKKLVSCRRVYVHVMITVADLVPNSVPFAKQM